MSDDETAEQTTPQYPDIRRLPPPETLVDVIMKAGMFDTLRQRLLETLTDDGSVESIERYAIGLGALHAVDFYHLLI
jgi:hypothetical protein